jgi:hypothetical protein
MNSTLREWHSTSARWEGWSRFWCDCSKTHNTGICQIRAIVSADGAASVFGIAELGLDKGKANIGTRARDWEVVEERVLLRLMKTHTFTSADGITHLNVIR